MLLRYVGERKVYNPRTNDNLFEVAGIEIINDVRHLSDFDSTLLTIQLFYISDYKRCRGKFCSRFVIPIFFNGSESHIK